MARQKTAEWVESLTDKGLTSKWQKLNRTKTAKRECQP